MSSKLNTQFQWKIRRRWITATLLFCAAMIVWVAWRGEDARIYETLLTSSYALATLILSVYVLGATWDDMNARKYGTPGDEGAPMAPVDPADTDARAG